MDYLQNVPVPLVTLILKDRAPTLTSLGLDTDYEGPNSNAGQGVQEDLEDSVKHTVSSLGSSGEVFGRMKTFPENFSLLLPSQVEQTQQYLFRGPGHGYL